MPLRGRLKFDKLGNVYFITTTLFNFERIFTLGDEYNMIVIDSLKYLIIRQRSSLFGYVIMPTHIHLLFHLPENESIIDFMRDFKRFTSRKITAKLRFDDHLELLKRLESYALGYNKQKYKVWMDRYDDKIVTTEKVLIDKLNYIHFNPVRASLVNNIIDWKYSSARNYYCGDNSIIDVNIDFSINA